jgi:hypothetical protein
MTLRLHKPDVGGSIPPAATPLDLTNGRGTAQLPSSELAVPPRLTPLVAYELLQFVRAAESGRSNSLPVSGHQKRRPSQVAGRRPLRFGIPRKPARWVCYPNNTGRDAARHYRSGGPGAGRFFPQDEPVNATLAPPCKRLYFVNAPVDFLLIGGASIIAFVLMSLFYSRESTPLVTTLVAQLLWLCNWPHFSASTYRLYHTRDNIRQYPVTALVIPFVVLAGVVAALLSPALVAPYFVKVFAIWSPYHFSGQTLGISLIYARRSGFKVGTWERLGLSGFIYGSFLSGTVRAEIGTNPTDYFGIPYRGLGLPEWTAQVTDATMWACGLLFAVLAVRWCLRNRRPMPPMVLLPAAAQYIWFVQSVFWESFRDFVPFFHSLQYLLIAWSVQLKEKMDVDGIRPSRQFVLGETVRWGALNLVGGAILFFVIPHLVSWTGLPLLFATGVVIAGVQIHHFFVDGVIWKLKNKKVASPLMVNLEDLLVPAAAA